MKHLIPVNEAAKWRITPPDVSGDSCEPDATGVHIDTSHLQGCFGIDGPSSPLLCGIDVDGLMRGNGTQPIDSTRWLGRCTMGICINSGGMSSCGCMLGYPSNL